MNPYRKFIYKLVDKGYLKNNGYLKLLLLDQILLTVLTLVVFFGTTYEVICYFHVFGYPLLLAYLIPLASVIATFVRVRIVQKEYELENARRQKYDKLKFNNPD